jgi:hypothetical protein
MTPPGLSFAELLVAFEERRVSRAQRRRQMQEPRATGTDRP